MSVITFSFPEICSTVLGVDVSNELVSGLQPDADKPSFGGLSVK
jgi:hypothetical protein